MTVCPPAFSDSSVFVEIRLLPLLVEPVLVPMLWLGNILYDEGIRADQRRSPIVPTYRITMNKPKTIFAISEFEADTQVPGHNNVEFKLDKSSVRRHRTIVLPCLPCA